MLDQCGKAALMQISHKSEPRAKRCVVRLHILFFGEVVARRGESNSRCRLRAVGPVMK